MTTASDHRLPRTVIPQHYDIELAPDLDHATFSGTVRIDVDLVRAVDTIVLNAADLELTEAALTAADGATVELTWRHEPATERLELHAPAPIQPGPATIALAFDGQLNDKLHGFYRSTLVDGDGNEQTIATTQFEATSARRAFPCWDEPDLKATFAVSLVTRPGLLAISSGPEIGRDELPDGRQRVRFGTTMVMSTYLLAFVVGPLEATDPVDVDGVPLRIIHPIGKGHLARFALDVGAFSLRHFTDYFGIPYPGEKLDLVALPDFAFGAMENLGCVTFREALLLLDDQATTQPEQQRVADVIAHEVAHMWFGDLVTMKWWDGIWLKEAFATFCETHAVDAMRPDWHRWADFSLSRTAAFDIDSLTTTRSIEYEVVSPADANAMYDVLTYEKGAAVVRMLEQYLGEQEFRDGIRHYLSRHAYGNTETHDLWDALEHTTAEPARQIMDSWISQGGCPMVTVELVDRSRIRIRQVPFTYLPVPDDDRRWVIPMVLTLGSGETTRRTPVLLNDDEMIVDVGPDPLDWLVGNTRASGFYRVRLLGDLREAAVRVMPTKLSTVERYGLVDDTWAAFLADQATYGEVAELVTAMAATENDIAVWRCLVGILLTVDDHLTGEARERHRAGAIALVRDASARVGADPDPGEPERRQELLALLFQAGGLLGDEDLIAEARRLLDEPADPAHNAAAIKIVAANGGPDDFARFVRAYREATDPQEERRHLFALPLFRGRSEILALLDLLDSRQIRNQDGAYILGSALGHSESAPLIWPYVATNWGELCQRYPDSSIPRMLEGAQSIGDPDIAREVLAFFETHELPQAGPTLFQYLERMRVSVGAQRRLREQIV